MGAMEQAIARVRRIQMYSKDLAEYKNLLKQKLLADAEKKTNDPKFAAFVFESVESSIEELASAKAELWALEKKFDKKKQELINEIDSLRAERHANSTFLEHGDRQVGLVLRGPVNQYLNRGAVWGFFSGIATSVIGAAIWHHLSIGM